MVDTPGLGPGAFGREGSTPFSGTKRNMCSQNQRYMRLNHNYIA